MPSQTVNLLLLPVHLVTITVLIVVYHIINLVRQFIPYKLRAKSVKDQIALVTGSGSGIGRLTAHRLAKLGAQVVLLDVNEKAIKEVEKEISSAGGKASAFKCDLSNRDEIYKVSDLVTHHFCLSELVALYNNRNLFLPDQETSRRR